MKVLALIFDGFEELEATAPFALLRRAGIDLTIASTRTDVCGSHQLHYTDITLLKQVKYQDFDALILPGGSHYLFLQKEPYIHQIISHFMNENKIVGTICAAPTILGQLGFLKNRNYTCFASMNRDFGGNFQKKYVVTDGNLITAISAAASIEFAYALIEKIAGTDTLRKVQEQIYYEK